jgi:hypothetical protein
MSKTKTLIVALLGLAIAAPAFADHDRDEHRREERREERREDRREERREDRREWRHDGPRAAPPGARFERHENRRGQVWINGNYEWRGNAYVWTPGRYEAERRGYMWREPRWEVRDGVYMRVEGEWYSPGPMVAPPVLREERFEARNGFVWVRGAWDWRAGEWAWVPGHYERMRVGHRWRDRRWENRNGVYVQVEGGWE